MAYNINKSNSDPVTIPTGVIDNQFDIPLVGQDAKNWGDDIALAFVRLLENFASDSAPAFGNARTPGQLWYDTSTSTLRVHNGSTFVAIPTGLETSAVALAADQVGTEERWISIKDTNSGTYSTDATLTTSGIYPLYQNFTVADYTAVADNEKVNFQIALPKRWNLGTITYQVYWYSADATANPVVWELDAGSISDAGDLDGAAFFGTAIQVVDTNGGANTLNVSDPSAAVTIAGSPADGDMCFFRIYRNAGDAGDTLAADARLVGVKLRWTSDAPTDT